MITKDDDPRADLEAQLHAYHDGELQGRAKEAFEKALARDPELARRLDDLRFVARLVTGQLDQRAADVHEARFEQTWDAFERTLEREDRARAGSGGGAPTAWERAQLWLRDVRMPLALAAGLAGVALVVMINGRTANDPAAVATTESKKQSTEEPSKIRENTVAPEPSHPAETSETKVAKAEPPTPPDMTDFPEPHSNDAEIEKIEFGGHTGTISRIEGSRGTTTVIWVTEDDEPVESERSL